ncbi:MAG: FG-GAP repeat protein [Planctomycetes bacterium]|nr:FG-GAP repeat protein [Planctomycetota bacterium]
MTPAPWMHWTTTFTILAAVLVGVAPERAKSTPLGQTQPADAELADAEAVRAARRVIVAGERGFAAYHPTQRWTSQFDGRGFELRPATGGWSWGLELREYGRAASLVCADRPARAQAEGVRLAYSWAEGIDEWYLNEAVGLEHGFTLRNKPEGVDETVLLQFSIRGALVPTSSDGRTVHFSTREGEAALRYGGLMVVDAVGQALDARMSTRDGGLRIEFNDSAAVYPVTVDPVVQIAYVKASNTNPSDDFGHAVAMSGNTMVVTARYEASAATGVNGNQADNSKPLAGAAYVFVRNGGVWSQQAYLKASNTDSGDEFGWSADISGDTIVIGAYAEDSAAKGVNGDGSNNSADFAGAAYVFTRTGTTWAQQAYLKASNTEPGDIFGTSVAVFGDTIVVGAPGEDSAATGVNGDQTADTLPSAGAAYVFIRSGSTWTQQAYLKASNTQNLDQFGYAVDISGDTAIVGAYLEDSNATGINGNQSDNGALDAGAAYVFVRVGGSWAQQAYLKASNTDADDWFGYRLAVSHNTAVISSHREDSNAVGVNGNGADNSTLNSGAVYVFVRSGGVWSQQAYLKASNTQSSDEFGWSVAVSGDVVVVGAVGEDSNAVGINGNQVNNSYADAGAAYVFSRAAGVWSQLAYVKASNTGVDDEFAYAVAVSGDLMAAGADREDSNATGVNGNQSNESGANSGACYVYDLGRNPGLVSYGTGTPGCNGTQTLGVFHTPMVPGPGFGFTCNNAPVSALGLGILGNVQDAAGSDPFFIGVLLHIDFFASTELVPIDFYSDASGNAAAPAPLPNSPALAGMTFYAMALWAWSSCSLPPYNLSTSRGLAFTVQLD